MMIELDLQTTLFVGGCIILALTAAFVAIVHTVLRP